MDQLSVLSSPASRNLRAVAPLEPEGQVIVRLTVPELAGVAVLDSVDLLNNMLNLNAQSTGKAMTMIISNLTKGSLAPNF